MADKSIARERPEMTIAREIARFVADFNHGPESEPDEFAIKLGMAIEERFDLAAHQAAPEPELPDFMKDHETWYSPIVDGVVPLAGEEDYESQILKKPSSEFPANIVSSGIAGGADSDCFGTTQTHRLILDLDFPAVLIPSSTPGHFHLYLDKQISEKQLGIAVRALYRAGIISKGNLNQWSNERRQFLRLPHIKKKENQDDKNIEA